MISVNHKTDLWAARSWAAKHARDILNRVENYPSNRPIILETGYGPSGLPHLGTIAEIIRTSMVAKVLRKLCTRKVIVIAFCDNLDGMRKVPPGMPNQDMLQKNLDKPLYNVPDPFEQYQSFAEYNLNQFCTLVNNFGYDILEYRPSKDKKYSVETLLELLSDKDPIILLRSSDLYHSRSFDSGLLGILNNYEKVLEVILPTLGEERRGTYSPFMPFSRKDGKVIETGVIGYDKLNQTIIVDDNGDIDNRIVDGKIGKLQWKIDFGMRWALLKIDYEMGGKDISIGTNPIASKVCEILGGNPPITPMYEMFLAEDGTRISKTKGNGITLEAMMKYMPTNAIKHFMFLNPMVAKRLDIHKLPSYIDSFLKDLDKFHQEYDVENSIWYTGDQIAPNINASMALNLIQSLNMHDIDLLLSFLMKKIKNFNDQDEDLLRRMFDYYNDHARPPDFRPLPDSCKGYLQDFLPHLSNDGTAMQTKLYDLGNEALKNNDVDDLKSWFKILYQAILGQDQGPRLGSFFALCGPEYSGKLIEVALRI